jgi:ubiquitin-protein ligase
LPAPDVCDIYDGVVQRLLSPMEESSELGLCQVALVLRYLQELRGTPNRFIPGIARLSLFPPVVLAMNRLKERGMFTRLDLVTITSVLYLLFAEFLSGRFPPRRVFECTLQCMSVVLTFGTEQIDVADGLYWPVGRIGQLDSYSGCMQNIFHEVPDLEPRPLTRDLRSCARNVIVRVSPYLGLALCASQRKPLQLTSTLTIINPMNRAAPVQRLSIELLSYGAGIRPIPPLPRVVDPSDVEQLVVFVLEATSRLTEEAMLLVETIFGYMLTRMSTLPCLGALMIAGGGPPTGPLELTADLQSLSRFNWPEPSRSVCLCDTLMVGASVLASEWPNYHHSQPRIVVVAGPPEDRTVDRFEPGLLPPAFRQNRIILDSVGIDADLDLNSLSVESGGYSLIVDAKNMDGALRLIDSRGFLDTRLRQGGGRCITTFEATELVPPRPEGRMHPSRQSRLRQEFQGAHPMFPDLALVEGMIDVWELTIRLSQLSCVYAGFPWRVVVHFPAGYPNEPPKIRFMNPPYHINVADDGEMCLAILTTQYKATITIAEVFERVQAVLLNPEPDNALSPYRLRKFVEDERAFTDAARARLLSFSRR